MFIELVLFDFIFLPELLNSFLVNPDLCLPLFVILPHLTVFSLESLDLFVVGIG